MIIRLGPVAQIIRVRIIELEGSAHATVDIKKLKFLNSLIELNLRIYENLTGTEYRILQ